MSRNTDDSNQKATELGKYLNTIRKDRGFTLRQVQEATNNEVSNAYLSQVETGKVKQPSPNMLHSLAELYSVEYTKLMGLAGYIKDSLSRNDTERHGRVATFSDINLSKEEEEALLKYLKFIRSE